MRSRMQTKQIVPFAANFYSIIKINTKNLKKMEKILIYLTDKYHGCFKYWWLSLILGIIFLALGILTFIFPFTSYLTMSIIFGITILVSGIFYIVMSTTRSMKGRGWLIVSGLIEIVLGILLTLWPGISAAILPYVLGFWLMFKGFTLIGIGSDMSDIKGSGWGWTIAWALGIIVCAFIILIYPLIFGMEAVILWVGITLLVGGGSLISFAINLKKGLTLPAGK
jgi:uncharacterized membrane protein HdeD (DUF308 family)